jgi:glucose-1-phosphate thymidylyltransferase
MIGVLLAGGTGSRLWPMTAGVSKQLLPIFNKPMIYYSLSSLMLAGIREIFVIVTPKDRQNFEALLGDGSEFGLTLQFLEQSEPLGIPHALGLVPTNVRSQKVLLALGDNVFFGGNVGSALADKVFDGAHAFGVRVHNPSEFGIVALSESGDPISLQEKPDQPSSDLAVPGLYFLDSSCFQRVEVLEPSLRGELEIVDLLKSYMSEGKLSIQVLPRGTAWLDTGRAESLARAGQFVEAVEANQGLLVGSPHEIAWRQGWITSAEVSRIAKGRIATDYGAKLARLTT